jgi:hypothetical protein
MILFRERWLRHGEVWFDEDPANVKVDIISYVQKSHPISGTQCGTFYTILNDLSQTPEELLTRMPKNTQYKIRRVADRDRVIYEFWKANSSDVLVRFCEFLDRFACLKGLSRTNMPRLRALSDDGTLDISRVGDKEGNDLVWHAHYRDRARVRLLHSASLFREVKNSAFRNLIGRANRYHHWQDMLRFKQEGILVYDFGGWYEGNTDQEKLQINRFKEEFGGKVVRNYNCVRLVTAKARLIFAIGKFLGRTG